MKKASRDREQGDMEIRVLKDGKVVLVAPDEKLISVAEAIDPDNAELKRRKKGKEDE